MAVDIKKRLTIRQIMDSKPPHSETTLRKAIKDKVLDSSKPPNVRLRLIKVEDYEDWLAGRSRGKKSDKEEVDSG